MDGGEVKVHRFEILVGGDDVKDPIQGEVGCRQRAEGERVEVRLEQRRGPLEGHIL